MTKGLNANSEINISVQFLLKAMVLVALVVGSYYQAMLRFSNIEVRINDIDRWNRSDEISQRHREDIVKELNDVTDDLAYLKGRINGKS